MKSFLLALSVIYSTQIFGAPTQDIMKTENVIAMLNSAESKVKWDVTSAVIADVTCDGKPDAAIVGYENDKVVWLGVVIGGKKDIVLKPITMSFTVDSRNQTSFCSIPVHIEVQPISCKDEDIGTLPGCKEVKGCSEFSMIDNACDSFHFYWDSSKKGLVWWRR